MIQLKALDLNAPENIPIGINVLAKTNRNYIVLASTIKYVGEQVEVLSPLGPTWSLKELKELYQIEDS